MPQQVWPKAIYDISISNGSEWAYLGRMTLDQFGLWAVMGLSTAHPVVFSFTYAGTTAG